MQAVPEHGLLHLAATMARHSVRSHLDAGHHADAANVGHQRMILQRVDGVEEILLEVRRVLEQAVSLIQLLCRDAGGAGCRVRRIGVAVEEFDGTFRRGVGHRVVDLVGHRDGTHRDRAVGDRLGHGDDVRLHIELLRRERGAHTAETGDHLVEDQQHAVLVTNLADLFQIADRRHQRAGGTGDGLDEDSGEGGAAKVLGDALEVHGHFGTGQRLALRETLLLGPGVANHRNVRKRQAEGLAVADHAGKRYTAHIDSVVGALAADQPVTLRLAAGPLIGQDDLDRRVHRLRSGVGKEHVVELIRQHPADALGKFEGTRVAKLEVRCVVVVQHLVVDRFGDLAAAMAGRCAEQGRRSVDDLTTFVVPHIHALGLDDHAGVLLEVTVCGKRHPVCFKRVHIIRHRGLLRLRGSRSLAPGRLVCRG